MCHHHLSSPHHVTSPHLVSSPHPSRQVCNQSSVLDVLLTFACSWRGCYQMAVVLLEGLWVDQSLWNRLGPTDVILPFLLSWDPTPFSSSLCSTWNIWGPPQKQASDTCWLWDLCEKLDLPSNLSFHVSGYTRMRTHQVFTRTQLNTTIINTIHHVIQWTETKHTNCVRQSKYISAASAGSEWVSSSQAKLINLLD